jgi:hypothetical protein
MTTAEGEPSPRPCRTWMAAPKTTALSCREVRSNHDSHEMAKTVRE